MSEISDLPFISQEALKEANWKIIFEQFDWNTDEVSNFISEINKKLEVPRQDLDRTLSWASALCKKGLSINKNGELVIL